jgi:hypothetical protein
LCIRDASSAEFSTPYDHVASHINHIKALDPVLVHDIEPQEYFENLSFFAHRN